MAGPSTWRLHYNTSGGGHGTYTGIWGTFGPLASGASQTITISGLSGTGQYFIAFDQRPGHPGTGVAWSGGCYITECTNPTVEPTDEPTVEPTDEPTV